MAGLNCIITGATSGLGFHTLKRLLRSGSFDYIIGLGRDIKKSEEALGELPQNNTNVEFVECDLSEVEAVKKFATSVMTKLPKIDLLVNVAGIMDSPTLFTSYGVEIQFATNHLGHFLLTKLLLSHMANHDARIINVTSGKYTKCIKPINFESVTRSQEFDLESTPSSNYSQSKLANCLFTVALDNYINQNWDKFDGVRVFCVRPGFVRGTELGRYHNYYLRMLAWPLIYMFSKDMDAGTDTIVHLCLAPIEELESGKLYYDKQVESYQTSLVNDKSAEDLWNLSEKLLDKVEKT